MNESTPCGEPCEACPSAANCPTHNDANRPIDLDEAVQRFEREATRGACDTGRYRMPYFTWGDGPPLLFIHGVADQCESFLLPIAILSKQFRCVAYDLPTGRGDGARLGRIRHADLVADVWALLDHLGIERAYLFASSFGSTIALAALRERPQRVPRAILQGGLAYRPLRRKELWAARLLRWLPGTMRKLPGRDRVLEAVHFQPFRDLPAKVWAAFLEITGRTPVRTLGHQLRLLHRLDLRPILPEIRQPVMLVVGERDSVSGQDCAATLQKGLPNAGTVILEGCGHVAAYTHPEMLAAVVGQFLTPTATPATPTAETGAY